MEEILKAGSTTIHGSNQIKEESWPLVLTRTLCLRKATRSMTPVERTWLGWVIGEKTKMRKYHWTELGVSTFSSRPMSTDQVCNVASGLDKANSGQASTSHATLSRTKLRPRDSQRWPSGQAIK